MRNYLITGGAGFIGANFTHYLLRKYSDIKVVVYDKLTYAGNLDNLLDADDDDGVADVRVLLTIHGCPLQNTIDHDVRAAIKGIEGITGIELELGVMSDEQRTALKTKLRGGVREREIPFAKAGNLTQVILIASGKGGVGKSSVTVNLAMALAGRGKRVGVLDADIYGHSIPQMLGLVDANPTSVDGMILPVPAMGLTVISIGMLKERRDQVIAWRGPMIAGKCTRRASMTARVSSTDNVVWLT